MLIVGLGNPLRSDDGVGPRVVEELLRRGLPAGVAALDAGVAGLDLLNLLEGPRRAIIVDAADVGQAPGGFVRFMPQDAHLAETADRSSFHSAGLAEALALARALEQPLPEIVVFGVQPASLDWGVGLSPAVEAGLPALVKAVLREVAVDAHERPVSGYSAL